jgi:hypothetical protein
MQTTLVVLTQPFVRLPAGTILELSEANGYSGWEEDDRLREKLHFFDKSTYTLPDGGNGLGYDLPLSNTMPCPPDALVDLDLTHGPCRITRAAFQTEEAGNDVWNTGFGLEEVEGLAAQAFYYPLEQFEKKPVKVVLFDALRQKPVRDITATGHFDTQDMPPGFYQLQFNFRQGPAYHIHFIKSFPVLILFEDKTGGFSTQPTLY